ncbi:hypothetical protein MNBD_GAMMA18-1882 [hydrothermal vent metagenome]|uniref:Uncharacterized protein n=1 Tax=hydrothermal vent metagenome TaxID=652676 RepID=A0A3B0ZSB3_9ZZZZ
MIKQDQSDYSVVKNRYESLRENSRKIAHDELPAVLTNKKNQAILKSTLTFSGINVKCINELKKWEMSGSRRVAWDWNEVLRVYKAKPKRFEMAIWDREHWLCSASIGKPTATGGKLRLDVIESNPNGTILVGLAIDINILSYKTYANLIGATELRIMNPVNDIVKNYYLNKKGFSYNQKEDFCFTEV